MENNFPQKKYRKKTHQLLYLLNANHEMAQKIKYPSPFEPTINTPRSNLTLETPSTNAK